jgi:hypothetical protein
MKEIIRSVPVTQWENQRDNINPFTSVNQPFNQCMVSSFVMMVNWLRDYLTSKGLKSFEYYNEITHFILVGESKEKSEKVRFISGNHASKINKMFLLNNIKFKFVSKKFSYDELVSYVDSNRRPVLVGTMETSAGHIVVFDGLWQNPYGKPDNKITKTSCKYISPNGKDLQYSDDFCREMVFREFDSKGITNIINTKRLCWIIEDIQ